MHNIIIDTNVFVSSLIQRGYPYRIVYELFIEDKIQLCTSEKLVYEYYEVLHRPKFSIYFRCAGSKTTGFSRLALASPPVWKVQVKSCNIALGGKEWRNTRMGITIYTI
jgi:predicted nucleic acid-binding protein